MNLRKYSYLQKSKWEIRGAMNNMNTREKFIQWLSSNPISKYSPNPIDNALDEGSDSKYSKIYQKLYYISKVYDDPNGMTLEKIMSMLGNGADEKLVISILNDVSWATKLADDIYSFGKNADSVLRGQIQPYKMEEKDIVTDGQFFDFLYNYEKMAKA